MHFNSLLASGFGYFQKRARKREENINTCDDMEQV